MSNTIITTTGEAALVRPDGDLVAAVVPELREALRGAVAEGAREIVVDLSAVTMLDSSGIGLLVAAHNSVRKLGGSLRVIRASEEIVELLHTLRIHRHIAVAAA